MIRNSLICTALALFVFANAVLAKEENSIVKTDTITEPPIQMQLVGTNPSPRFLLYEFTPTSNPSYTCIVVMGTGGISCFPKAGVEE